MWWNDLFRQPLKRLPHSPKGCTVQLTIPHRWLLRNKIISIRKGGRPFDSGSGAVCHPERSEGSGHRGIRHAWSLPAKLRILRFHSWQRSLLHGDPAGESGRATRRIRNPGAPVTPGIPSEPEPRDPLRRPQTQPTARRGAAGVLEGSPAVCYTAVGYGKWEGSRSPLRRRRTFGSRPREVLQGSAAGRGSRTHHRIRTKNKPRPSGLCAIHHPGACRPVNASNSPLDCIPALKPQGEGFWRPLRYALVQS